MKLFNLLTLAALLVAFSLTSCQKDTAEAKDTKKADVTAQPVAEKTTPANTATPVPAGPLTTMTIEEVTHDFGTITDGDKVRHAFKVKNTGAEPLLISQCKGSCGCTAPTCPKTPVAPGESTEIVVEYNSKGKSSNKEGGKADTKFVNVTANTEPAQTRLTIKALVMPDPNAPKPAAKPVAAPTGK